jgi:hypothetical protein
MATKKKAAKKQKAKKQPVKKQKTKRPPAKKRKTAKPQKTAKPKLRSKATGTLRTPDICAPNFSANNLDPVQFQSIPAIGVRLTQKSATDPYPFTPVTGTYNGLSYTDVATSGRVTVSVTQSATTTYSYNVNCSCPGQEGSHSVTVNS